MRRTLISKLVLFLLTFVLFVGLIIPANNISAKQGKLVYVAPIEQGIERGLERFLERVFKEAEDYYADAIILEINTLGGAVDAALNIGKLIQSEDIQVIAYIKGEAISAGSYISLNADKIYMEPGSYIGAAAVRTIAGREADPKITSVWIAHMRDAAKRNGKDPDIAEGMVNPNLDIPGITKKGELITLDSGEAYKYGIANDIVNNRDELLTKLGLEQAKIVETKLTPAERLARFVTNPYIIPILLIIGLAGIVIELFAPGFGVSGLVGISAFGLYFFGHYFAGFAGWEALILFLFGFILLVIELFVPGFGVFGILGIISLVIGIGLAAYETTYGLLSLAIAFIVNTVIFIILVKYFGHRGVWNRFILKEEQRKEKGYVSHGYDKTLVGKKGVTLTKLRPSGAALIEGKRFDVVSEGSIINVNQEIEIILVEGTRIVVKEVKNK